MTILVNVYRKESMGDKKKIAVFLGLYKSLNETFVLNELIEMQLRSIPATIYYEAISTKQVQPEYKKIVIPSASIYDCPFRLLKSHMGSVFSAHAQAFFYHPRGYFRALRFLIRVFNYTNVHIFIRAGLLVDALRRDDVNLIYVHDSETVSLLGIMCSFFIGVPCGIIFHTEGLFAKQKFLKEKIMVSNFSVFQSSYSKFYAKLVTGISSEVAQKMFINSSAGIDTDFFKPDNTKERIGTPGALKVVSVARLEELKGLNRLIQAIYLLKKKRIAIWCVIVGYGSKEKELRQLVQSLDLMKEVHFAGKIRHSKKLLHLMQSADMFILPSIVDQKGDRDMQPNVVKEAMAVGLPVIASRLGGIEEVINDGVNGFLLSSCSPADIARAIWSVSRMSKKNIDEIKKQARNTIKKKFDRKKVTEELFNLFDNQINGYPLN